MTVTTTPSIQTTVNDLKGAIIAIAKTITPDAQNAEPYASYQISNPPFWKVYFPRSVSGEGDGIGGYMVRDLSAVASYCVETVTGALVSVDAESEAQLLLLTAPAEFKARPNLQSSGTYANGVEAIRPEGITVGDAALRGGTLNGQNVLYVDIQLTIPLIFQMEELLF